MQCTPFVQYLYFTCSLKLCDCSCPAAGTMAQAGCNCANRQAVCVPHRACTLCWQRANGAAVQRVPRWTRTPHMHIASLLRQEVDWVVITCCIFWLLHACWNAVHDTLQRVLLSIAGLFLPLRCWLTGIVSLLFALLQCTLRSSAGMCGMVAACARQRTPSFIL